MSPSLERLHLRPAEREDAPRIAEIHMDSFGPNAMLHAQFPTPAVRKGLQVCVEEKAAADIDDPKTTVLVVSSSDNKKDASAVIGFAKWSHPVLPGEDYVEPPWKWPEGTDLQTLDAWVAKADEIANRSVGESPCYRLPFIGVDPDYGHRGAGQLMVQWGIQQSNKTGFPLYLESTVEAAPFYEKIGFTAGETISLPICVDGGNETQIYEEIVFTYKGSSE